MCFLWCSFKTVLFLLWNISLLVSLAKCEFARTKVWKNAIRLEEERMWQKNLLPCGNQRVVMPKEGVFKWPSNLPLTREMVLPMTGMLLLPAESQLIYDSRFRGNNQSCEGDAIVKVPEFQSWHNPDNWMILDENVNAIPHLNRLPCRHDHVLFRDDQVFKVEIALENVQIASLKVAGADQSTVGFRYLHKWDSLGKLLFNVSKEVEIEEAECIDSKGCMCGHENNFDNICSLITCPNSDTLPCSNALRPELHCCYDVCGSLIRLRGQNVQFELLERIIAEFMSSADQSMHQLRSDLGRPRRSIDEDISSEELWNSIEHDLSRISEDDYQIVLVDETIEKAVRAADQLREKLNKILENTNTQIWTQQSDTTPPSFWKSLKIFLMWLMLAIAILATLILFIRATTKTGNGRMAAPQLISSINPLRMMKGDGGFSSAQFRFERFGNDEGVATLELPETRATAFHNPVFPMDNPMHSLHEEKVVEHVELVKENPSLTTKSINDDLMQQQELQSVAKSESNLSKEKEETTSAPDKLSETINKIVEEKFLDDSKDSGKNIVGIESTSGKKSDKGWKANVKKSRKGGFAQLEEEIDDYESTTFDNPLYNLVGHEKDVNEEADKSLVEEDKKEESIMEGGADSKQ